MKKALLIVDVQNDFVEGGSLAVAGGVRLAEQLSDWLSNGAVEKYDVIATSQDWHIDPEGHFSDEPDFDSTWPPHCVARTTGSEIVEVLRESLMGHVQIAVHKGMFSAAYSAFEGYSEDGVSLAEMLRMLKVTHVDVVGIATDYCVSATAIDSALQGFSTSVISNLVVGINQEKIEEYLEDVLPSANIEVKQVEL